MSAASFLSRVTISGYRSARSLDLELGPLTVVSGPNGVGKSTVFRAIALLQAAGRGDLARALAVEGGLASALWAGARAKGPVRMTLAAEIDGLAYSVALGAPRPTDAALDLDPVVKEETIKTVAAARRTVMFHRKGPRAEGRDDQGRRVELSTDLWLFETALGRVADPKGAPEAARLKALLADIAIYDGFRVDPASPLRTPQPKVATARVADDGADWAAALFSRLAIADGFQDIGRSPAARAIAEAFPGAAPHFFEEGFSLEDGLSAPEFPRPFRARELSEGTLRYMALAAALFALRPPRAIFLNEPEASLNERLIEPLSVMIAEAASGAQIVVATHHDRLAELLDIEHGAARIRLEKVDGETRRV